MEEASLEAGQLSEPNQAELNNIIDKLPLETIKNIADMLEKFFTYLNQESNNVD